MSDGGLENVVVACVTKHHEAFAQKFARFLGLEQYVREVIDPHKFPCGEVCPTAGIDLEGKHLVLVALASPHKDPQAVVYRTGEAADVALNDLDAKTVDVVMPHMIKGRQDSGHKEHPDDTLWKGKGVTLRFIAKTLHSGGVRRVLTMHGHSEKMYDIFGKVWEKDGRDVVHEIIPHTMVAHYIRRHSSFDLSDGGARFVLVAPDQGAKKFVKLVHDSLYLPNITVVKINKNRKKPSDPKSVEVRIANYKELKQQRFTFNDKSVLVLDDLADRGGTLLNDIRFIIGEHNKFRHEFGKPADVSEYFTHPVLAGDQYEERQEMLMKETSPREVITTNTLSYIDEGQALMFQRRASILRVGAFFADAFENCCLKNIRPKDFYKFKSFEQLERKMGGLYSVERSEDMHFLKRTQ